VIEIIARAQAFGFRLSEKNNNELEFEYILPICIVSGVGTMLLASGSSLNMFLHEEKTEMSNESVEISP